MGSKAQKQTKLTKICKAPIRILSKARDFYVKGMNELAGAPSASLPKSASHSATYSSFEACGSGGDHEDFRQLVRAASARVGAGGMLGQQPSGVARSYSVSVGKIGVIEEEKACEFEEDGHGRKANLVCPRGRSRAAVNRNFA